MTENVANDLKFDAAGFGARKFFGSVGQKLWSHSATRYYRECGDNLNEEKTKFGNNHKPRVCISNLYC